LIVFDQGFQIDGFVSRFAGGWPFGDNKADTMVQLARMPFNHGDDAAFLVPRSSLIAEAGMEKADMVWRTANGARQQMGDALLENLVRLEADDVQETLVLQKLINVRCGEGGIASEIATQGTPLQITKLVEQEQRAIGVDVSSGSTASIRRHLRYVRCTLSTGRPGIESGNAGRKIGLLGLFPRARSGP
jgi:hypothetical protein